jgi:shikimate 5-dehydrogenase
MTRTILLAAAASLATIGAANAAIPFFNATCPTGIEVHADKGGPIYINGKEATLKVFNKNAYEAKHGHITLDLTINPDGTPMLTYTRDKGANGICTIAR